MGEAKKRKLERQSQGHGESFTKQMTLPQRVLENAIKGFDGFWRLADLVRRDPTMVSNSSGPWNSWCYIPVNVVVGIVSHLMRDRMTAAEVEGLMVQETRMLSAVSAWRMTKGVYVFDPLMAEAILSSDVEEELPDELFFHLPEWCPYISTPDLELREGLYIHGFFAYLDDRNHGQSKQLPPELNFEVLVNTKLSSDEALVRTVVRHSDLSAIENFDLSDLSSAVEHARTQEYAHYHIDVSLGQGKFSKAFLEEKRNVAKKAGPDSMLSRLFAQNELAEVMRIVGEEQGKLLARLGSLLLYLVSDKADISPEADLSGGRNRIVANEGRGFTNRQAEKIVPWSVGFRIGAEIRAFKDRPTNSSEFPGAGTSMRPHVRRAHWHLFWTGPRDQPENRKKRIRWLPPTPVNVSESDDLIPTMHRIVG